MPALVVDLPRVVGEAVSGVAEGGKATVRCRVHSARPDVTGVKWFHDGDRVQLGRRWEEGGTMTAPTLGISSVTRTDAGNYVCRLTNMAGFSDSRPIPLKVFCECTLHLVGPRHVDGKWKLLCIRTSYIILEELRVDNSHIFVGKY